MKYFPHVLPPLKIDTELFSRCPALLCQNSAATGLELSLALCSSKALLPSHATIKHDAATVSGLLRKAFQVELQLSRIKFDNPDAAGAGFPAIAFSELAAFLPVCPSGATSGPSLHPAATRPLSATLLHPSAVSALFSPTESLAAAVAAAHGLRVLLAWEFF